ncbi:twin-arginine translocase subunit TatC [Aeromicrobium sp. A1-2]|nr:twin-arginine translocase subunit TatC [Aeromicrobium sp. A1-2]
MPLMEHLRELRRRLTIATLSILLGTIVGWYFFDPIFDILKEPYETGIASLLTSKDVDAKIVISGGIGTAFSFRLKLALVIGLILASPVWINQIWRFVLPALHRSEKRWAYLLTATGVPLFLAGIYVGYLVLPKGIEVLIGFVPSSIDSLTSLSDYLNFVLRTLLVFGIAAEIPLVVVMLNRLGIVSAAQLARARPWTIIGIFVFAAIATPSTDPLTMLFLAIPMVILYLLSEIIAKLTDRRRGKAKRRELADDELSSLDD